MESSAAPAGETGNLERFLGYATPSVSVPVQYLPKKRTMEHSSTPYLPMELMHKILTHTSDPAALARLASSYKFWRDLIKDSTFLDHLRRRHNDHGFTPSILLGIFFQKNFESTYELWQDHMDQILCLAPSFMPISELSQFTGSKSTYNRLSLETFIQGIGARLNYYEPVASQGSFMAFCGYSQATYGKLFVCNPLTGEIFNVPGFRNKRPCHYALFVTDNGGLHDAMPISQPFELVAIWIKKKFIAWRYSSKTRKWQRMTRAPELMACLYLVSSTPPAAAISHGVIRWLCGSRKTKTTTHVATLRVNNMVLSYLEIPPAAKGNNTSPLLANSASGELLLLLANGLQLSLWRHSNNALGGSDGSSWVLCQSIDMRRSSLPLCAVRMGKKAKVNLEMFRGRSGMVVLWIEGEGQFLFSLTDGSLRKIDSEHMTRKYRVCLYEIDWLTCLAMTNLVVDGSLALDEGRRKAQERWRTLMSKNLANQ